MYNFKIILTVCFCKFALDLRNDVLWVLSHQDSSGELIGLGEECPKQKKKITPPFGLVNFHTALSQTANYIT